MTKSATETYSVSLGLGQTIHCFEVDSLDESNAVVDAVAKMVASCRVHKVLRGSFFSEPSPNLANDEVPTGNLRWVQSENHQQKPHSSSGGSPCPNVLVGA